MKGKNLMVREVSFRLLLLALLKWTKDRPTTNMKVPCYRQTIIIALGAITVCALTTLNKYLGSKSLQVSMRKGNELAAEKAIC